MSDNTNDKVSGVSGVSGTSGVSEDSNTNSENSEKELEPRDYFELLKSNIKESTREELSSRLKVVEELIKGAESVGQKSLIRNLKLTWSSLIKEFTLIENGITKYVKKSAIIEYIDNVEPKDSVKIIELSRYPRIIPNENLKEIERVKNLGIFDEFCVLFTDLTDNDYKTDEEKQFVKQNRDPICLGFFMNRKSNEKHEDFYVITDWEDEFCDLTYDKLITKLSEEDHGTLDITESVEEKWNRFYKANIKDDSEETKKNTKSILQKLKSWLFHREDKENKEK